MPIVFTLPSRLQAAVAKRPTLATDIRSLVSRPCVADAWDRASRCLHRQDTSFAEEAAKRRMLATLEEAIDDAHAAKIVEWVSYASRHPSTYAILGGLEAAMDQDDVRVGRLAALLAKALATEQIAALDGRLTVEALRHFLDTLPHVAHSGLGELLVAAEARMESDPGAATDWALDAADAAVRWQLQHKALLLLLVLGVPRAKALLRNRDVAVVAVGLLAVLPLPLVAAVAGAVARYDAGRRRGGLKGPAAA